MQELPPVDKIFKEEGIICHSFSPDGTLCAVSLKKSHVIEIYRLQKDTYKQINTWKYETQLKEHQQTVSDLSFSIQNKLLSVSHDKSILVWTKDNTGKWIKESVQCENKLGCLKCCWSPNGKKFAVGCGDHKIYIGYFDSKNHWWSTVPIKGPKGSISALRFHPSSKAIAVGSMDFTLRLITLNLKSNFQHHLDELVQGKATPREIESHHSLYADQLNQEDDSFNGKFTHFDSHNESVIEISQLITGGWIESVAFSPNGLVLTFSVHNSTVFNVAITAEGETKFNSTPLYLKGLPISSLLYKDDSTLIAGTYEGSILQLESTANSLKVVKNIEAGSDQSAFSVAKNKVGATAQIWEKKTQTNTVTSSSSDKGHTNPVVCIQQFPGDKSIVSSNDINGHIFFWNV